MDIATSGGRSVPDDMNAAAGSSATSMNSVVIPTLRTDRIVGLRFLEGTGGGSRDAGSGRGERLQAMCHLKSGDKRASVSLRHGGVNRFTEQGQIPSTSCCSHR